MVKSYVFNAKKLRKLNTTSGLYSSKSQVEIQKSYKVGKSISKASHPYDRVKWCRGRKINIKTSERVNITADCPANYSLTANTMTALAAKGLMGEVWKSSIFTGEKRNRRILGTEHAYATRILRDSRLHEKTWQTSGDRLSHSISIPSAAWISVNDSCIVRHPGNSRYICSQDCEILGIVTLRTCQLRRAENTVNSLTAPPLVSDNMYIDNFVELRTTARQLVFITRTLSYAHQTTFHVCGAGNCSCKLFTEQNALEVRVTFVLMAREPLLHRIPTNRRLPTSPATPGRSPSRHDSVAWGIQALVAKYANSWSLHFETLRTISLLPRHMVINRCGGLFQSIPIIAVDAQRRYSLTQFAGKGRVAIAGHRQALQHLTTVFRDLYVLGRLACERPSLKYGELETFDTATRLGSQPSVTSVSRPPVRPSVSPPSTFPSVS
ncbi:hypothetical protein PR048_033272 [Dryococelus australis]|uniref:Uncharacterized protein n=1 Tax=Dryococelus australis TaxID=614101 RepID=A0ABQ9G2P0_9NEOP|nr:hypothetical protein PR048_033272 [Dryococelus australis]